MVLMLVSVLAVVILVANLDDTDLGGNDGSSQEMVDDIVNGLLPIALVLAGVLFVYIVISVFSKRTRMRGPAQKEGGSSILPLFIMMVGIAICALVLLLRRTAGGDPDIDGGNSTNGTDGGADEWRWKRHHVQLVHAHRSAGLSDHHNDPPGSLPQGARWRSPGTRTPPEPA